MATKIGRQIKRARTATGATALSVAKAAGVDVTVYHRIESGEIANPSFSTIANIARVLGLDLNLVAKGTLVTASEGAISELRAFHNLEKLRRQLSASLKSVDAILEERRLHPPEG